MNSNQPKLLSKIDKTSKISSISNFANESLQNSNLSNINRVSILETEEQKKIVRTNVYEPNNSKSGNKQQFTVVTELISRSSNISFDHQHNSFNNGPLNFSFNQTNSDLQMNQSFQNNSINFHIADSSSKKEEIKNIGNMDNINDVIEKENNEIKNNNQKEKIEPSKTSSSKNNDSFFNKLIFNKYKPVKKLGEGSFGKIYTAINLATKEEYAVKLVSK